MMMNRLSCLALTALLCAAVTGARAEVHPVLGRALCQAAAQDSALGPQSEVLLERGVLDYADVPQVLNLPCEAGRSLMQTLVSGLRAENLEYVVIDLGLDPDAPLLEMAGEHLTLQQFLQRSATAGEPAVQRFARDYLRDFRDAEFNPNLAVSVLMPRR